MRLAIADPPYMGRARLFYGEGPEVSGATGHLMYKADHHPDADMWDNPATHEALVRRLMNDYDGFAIAMVPDNLRHYLRWVPEDVVIAVWHDPRVMPTQKHPRRKWEPVIVKRCEGRKRVVDVPTPVGDVLTCQHPQPGHRGVRGYAGMKPPQWTRWVLDMLGYNPDTDTVDDLFPGSGAVGAEVAQGTLL